MGYVGMSGVFEEKNGVCKPGNASTLAQYKAMQTQLNRCATALSLSRIAVDGDIGQGTLRLLSNISSKLYNSTITYEAALANAASSSCSEVATNAVNITYWAQWTADRRGTSTSTPPPSSSSGGGSSYPVSSLPPGGGVTAPGIAAGGLWDKVKALGTVEKAALGIGLLAAGVYAGIIPFGKKRRGGTVRR